MPYDLNHYSEMWQQFSLSFHLISSKNSKKVNVTLVVRISKIVKKKLQLEGLSATRNIKGSRSTQHGIKQWKKCQE